MAVITFSRQYGSGGDVIAVRVCEVLGYQYFDKQSLLAAASQEKLTPDQVVDYHEDSYKIRGILDRVRGYRPPPRRGPAALRDANEQIGENMLVWLADAAVRSACAQGNFVIVGRGGQAILMDQPGVLHVRIEAPCDQRIARIQQMEGVSQSAARLAVSEHDRAGADYLRRFYGVNWADPLLYHLSINTGRCTIDAAIDLVICAVGHVSVPAPEAEPVAA